jgi:hypothetical protein
LDNFLFLGRKTKIQRYLGEFLGLADASLNDYVEKEEHEIEDSEEGEVRKYDENYFRSVKYHSMFHVMGQFVHILILLP